MQSPLRISRIQLSQGQIFWREVGKGKPMIFLHGAYADSSQWLKVIDHLEGHYHCFAPDLLGFGESEPPNVHQSIALQVECLTEYIEALRLERPYLVGHSLGGWVAASYAEKYGERLEGLILVSPEGIEVEEQKERWNIEKLLVDRTPLFFLLLKAISPFAAILRLRKKIDALLNYRTLLVEHPASCQLLFARHQAEIQQEFLNGKLSQFQTQTLILQGGQDKPTNLAQSKAYAKAIAQAKLRVMKNGDTYLIENWPDSIAREIQGFAGIPVPM
ncbi:MULTISPECIES: alpha/beta hydrolase [Spirulina sp. CCY15215]|uniref:alpha/beta fold hydrolase n=1 Tax=Spirulina sp. CCY15215 TaxID=2767591 RepID=UPI0019515E10|nr:alpha/beta hydrolase [Spirulina major]